MEYVDPESGDLVDLETVEGRQKALKLLGYDPGACDGVDGPNTRAAVKKFQHDAGLAADGIIGPKTNEKLLEAVGNKLAG